jgi:hypothetical protein
MPGDVGNRREGGHRVVDISGVKVSQHQLGLGPTHTRKKRPGDHPVRADQLGLVHIVETEGKLG